MADYKQKWLDLLTPKEKGKLKDLLTKINILRQKKTIYPNENKVLNALKLTNPDNVKVVIIGQDPYHGENQANGLAFAVNDTVATPPSLNNIHELLRTTYNLKESTPLSKNLISWAKQGVLLLNTSLTVERAKPRSHADLGWAEITQVIIEHILERNPNVILVCWGQHAHDVAWSAVTYTHSNPICFISSHPSPYSARKPFRNYPAFMKSDVFNKINQTLVKLNKEPINWIDA